jgi:hypothetical protein
MPNLYTPEAVLSHYTDAELDSMIKCLEQECAEAGDSNGVHICIRALDGMYLCRRWCAMQIANANDRRDND